MTNQTAEDLEDTRAYQLALARAKVHRLEDLLATIQKHEPAGPDRARRTFEIQLALIRERAALDRI